MVLQKYFVELGEIRLIRALCCEVKAEALL
jgi:hypothetical protein